MTAATDAFIATTPDRFWPMTETSGTNVNELVANEDGTCVGMTMGGVDGPPSLGGKAAAFSGGTERILVRSAKILGGAASWTVGAWVYYDPGVGVDESSRFFYGEANPTTGNDRLGAGVNGWTSSALRINYGDDGHVPIDLGGPVTYIYGIWALVFVTFDAPTNEWAFHWNGATRSARADGFTDHTWTNTGVVSWIGGMPRSGINPWKGAISHLGLWSRRLTQSDMHDIYWACTPPARTLKAATPKIFSRPTAIWNQDLLVPSNPPTITADSATVVARLAYQGTHYGGAGNASTGPLWVADSGDPTQRVRIMGGHTTIASNSPDLYNALADVPIPAGAEDFLVQNYSDHEGGVWNEDTDEYWDLYYGIKTIAPTQITAVASSGGTVPAGSHSYYACAIDAAGDTGLVYYPATVTTSGSQKVTLNWGEIEDPIDGPVNHVAIIRDGFIVGTVAHGVQTFIDTGFAAGAALSTFGTSVTSDWMIVTGGAITTAATSIGHYEAPHANWGNTATSLPAWAGTISVMEALSGTIDHAIAMGIPEVYLYSHVYPAQRNDGWFTNGHSIQEGTRFQLDPDFDVETLDYEFDKMVATAFQRYGGYARDVSPGRLAVYIEDPLATGRDWWSEIFEGRYSYEILGGFPWDQMRVIDPAWTQEQTAADVIAPGKWGSVIEPFNTFDTVSSWSVGTGTAAVVSGQLALDTNPLTIVESRFTADILESEIVVDVGSTGAAYAGGTSAITLINGQLFLQMFVAGAAPHHLGAGVRNSGATITYAPEEPVYSAVAHRYWRIRDHLNTIYFETSPDGVTWTVMSTFLRAPLGFADSAFQALKLQIATNAYGVSPPVLPDFIIGGINVLAGGVAPPPGSEPAGEAEFTISSAPWSDGTVVNVYAAAAWPEPAHAPSGVVVATATVAANSVHFTGLATKVAYVAYALGHGIRFLVKPPIDPALRSATGREVLETLEEQLTALQSQVDALT